MTGSGRLVTEHPRPYNPLDYANLTRNLVEELMRREPMRLPLRVLFPGPGVYALFYDGGFPVYADVRAPEADRPIYAGKAVPPGARKGGRGEGDVSAPTLFKRISEHSSSLEAASNLDVKDFRCRFLTVEPLWITMAERFLIEHYRPIWNVCVEGFGNHDPGQGRHKGEVSWWDTLHPGRAWAKKLEARRAVDQVHERVAQYLTNLDRETE